MKHPYTIGCECARCLRERDRRAKQARASNPLMLTSGDAAVRASLRRGRRREYASRSEQHARYLDCGPGAWDDRDSESGDY